MVSCARTSRRFSMPRFGTTAKVFTLLAMLAVADAGTAAANDTELVSVTATSDEAAGHRSYLGVDRSISADGRYVVFQSDAPTLVPGDHNNSGDVFVRDRQTGRTERISVSSTGVEGNLDSYGGFALSADGRYVAFASAATNLVPGDSNNASDIFVHDRQTGRTERVSVDSNGVQANFDSARPSLSADGRFVAFESAASNLAPGDARGGADVFVHDRQSGRTERVSVDLSGTANIYESNHAAISADGRYVGFATSYYSAEGRVNVWLRDRDTGATELISVDSDGAPVNQFSDWPSVSANGRYVAFQSASSELVPGGGNGFVGIFVRDRQTGHTELASGGSNGAQANGPSWNASISADGRHVAFESLASNLVAGDRNDRYDIFVRDRQTGRTERVSVATSGAPANGHSFRPSISATGRYVAFDSVASNLAAHDFNHDSDVFVHVRDLGPGLALFTIKPGALAFGEQALFTGTTSSFWLRNKGATALSIVRVGLGGTDAAMFTIAHRCGAVVAIGAGCKISVTFRPTSAGLKSATLRIVAGGDVMRTRELTGTGANSAF